MAARTNVIWLMTVLVHSVTAYQQTSCIDTSFSIACSNDDDIIVVNSAYYGMLPGNPCNARIDIVCRSPLAANVVNSRCSGRNRCEFLVTADLFRDLCLDDKNALEVTYECVPRSKLLSICDTPDLPKDGEYLASPNYPNKYPNAVKCVAKLSAGAGYKVYTRILDIDIEQRSRSPGCYDYVTLEERDKNYYMYYYCGHMYHVKSPLERMYDDLIVTFHTDRGASKHTRGFLLRYEITRDPKITTTTTAKSGNGIADHIGAMNDSSTYSAAHVSTTSHEPVTLPHVANTSPVTASSQATDQSTTTASDPSPTTNSIYRTSGTFDVTVPPSTMEITTRPPTTELFVYVTTRPATTRTSTRPETTRPTTEDTTSVETRSRVQTTLPALEDLRSRRPFIQTTTGYSTTGAAISTTAIHSVEGKTFTSPSATHFTTSSSKTAIPTSATTSKSKTTTVNTTRTDDTTSSSVASGHILFTDVIVSAQSTDAAHSTLSRSTPSATENATTDAMNLKTTIHSNPVVTTTTVAREATTSRSSSTDDSNKRSATTVGVIDTQHSTTQEHPATTSVPPPISRSYESTRTISSLADVTTETWNFTDAQQQNPERSNAGVITAVILCVLAVIVALIVIAILILMRHRHASKDLWTPAEIIMRTQVERQRKTSYCDPPLVPVVVDYERDFNMSEMPHSYDNAQYAYTDFSTIIPGTKQDHSSPGFSTSAPEEEQEGEGEYCKQMKPVSTAIYENQSIVPTGKTPPSTTTPNTDTFYEKIQENDETSFGPLIATVDETPYEPLTLNEDEPSESVNSLPPPVEFAEKSNVVDDSELAQHDRISQECDQQESNPVHSHGDASIETDLQAPFAISFTNDDIEIMPPSSPPPPPPPPAQPDE